MFLFCFVGSGENIICAMSFLYVLNFLFEVEKGAEEGGMGRGGRLFRFLRGGVVLEAGGVCLS